MRRSDPRPGGEVSLRNCILWGNTRIQAGGPPLADQIYSPGYAAEVTYSDVEGGWPGTGNINVDPQFVNATAADYRLQTTSPCKNAGNTNDLPADSADLDWDTNTIEQIPKDLSLLLPRVRLGAVDMGAYEIFNDPPPGGHDPPPVLNE